MRPVNYDELRAHVVSLGHVWFEAGKYDLNIVGARSRNMIADRWDDAIMVGYVDDDGVKRVHQGVATLDPGLHYLENPTRAAGTAFILPGQYRRMFTIGVHNRSRPSRAYEALEQVGPARYFRDNDRDEYLPAIMDEADLVRLAHQGRIETGIIKSNIHKRGTRSTERVGAASAACPVYLDEEDFNETMRLAHLQVQHGHGRYYTFTVVTAPMGWTP